MRQLGRLCTCRTCVIHFHPLMMKCSIARLLHDMGELMGHQVRNAGSFTDAEVDVSAMSKCLGANSLIHLRRFRIGMDPHAAEIDSEPRFHIKAHMIRQGAAPTLAAG